MDIAKKKISDRVDEAKIKYAPELRQARIKYDETKLRVKGYTL